LHLDIELCSFNFNADGEDTYAFARSTEHLLEIVDVVLRLLAVSVVHSVSLHNWSYLEGTSINAPTLAYLMEQCQSLKLLSLQRLEMDENHCRMLGDFSRPDLEIVLDGCRVTSAGSSALAEVLGRNQGPNKLCSCFEIDNVVLADGLRGNSRLKSLTARFSNNAEVSDRELLAIAGALRENKGLVDLDLSCLRLKDDTWDTVCESIKTHPTLEVLNLRATSEDDADDAYGDDIVEDDIVEDDASEDDASDDDASDDDASDDDASEDDIVEDDASEDDASDDDASEDDIVEDDIVEDDINEDDINEDDINEDDTSGGYSEYYTSPKVLKSRILQALVDMMKVNMSIHTIDIEFHLDEECYFRRSVDPYLETNRLRSRVRAIQQTRPIPYRAKVMGIALLSARSDANRFWMLL
jgi:hypothetical protein